jgi:transposase
MSMQQVPAHRRVVVGVDTHKYVHVAVVIDDLGTSLGSQSFAADSGGYTQLIDWAAGFGGKLTFGIEGTGSYGAGLAGAVRRRNIGTVEVVRTDRRDRRLRGKSDTIDAENAARAVLSGQATAVPKTNDGVVEMIRQIKVAKDIAVKARTAAIISLKQVIVNAPPELREELQPLTKMALINRCAGLRPGPITTITASSKHTLRAIARRWQQLNTEIVEHEKVLTGLTTKAAPQLSAAFAVGPDTAAEMLIVSGDNPPTDPIRGRVRPPVRCRTHPGLVRDDDPSPAQPRRAPASQRSPLPRRDRPDATPRAHQGLRRSQDRRGQDESRDHPLPQTAPRPRTLGRHATPAPNPNRSAKRGLTDIGASTPPSNRSGPGCKRTSSTREGGKPANNCGWRSSPGSKPNTTADAVNEPRANSPPSSLRRPTQPRTRPQNHQPRMMCPGFGRVWFLESACS